MYKFIKFKPTLVPSTYLDNFQTDFSMNLSEYNFAYESTR